MSASIAGWPQLYLPVAIVSLFMIIGAVVDGWKLKVPNRLCYPMILLAWVFWLALGLSVEGSLLPAWRSVAGAFVAGLPLLLIYMIGGMGAGDVKLYAGFGAWMVPVPWFGFSNLWWALMISIAVGGVIALGMIAYRGLYFTHLANAREIVHDVVTSPSLGEISRRAKERKPQLMLLPYGIPLTLGSLGYIAYLMLFPAGIL